MFDFRAGGIAAGAAFVISFLISLVSGASFPGLILRPLVFAALFFGIALVVYFLVSRFLPELLDDAVESGGGVGMPGSRIDISEPDVFPGAAPFTPAAPQNAAIPANFAKTDDSDENLDDISGYVRNDGDPSPPVKKQREVREAPAFQESPSGLDQEDQYGYNEKGSPGTLPVSGENAAVSGADPGDFLPDLDSLAGVFAPSSGEKENDTIEYSTSAPAKKPSPGSKGQKMEGDFNPKDLAAGIRTILNKED
jgi:hypothetical protein